jgi:hypothetical protein
MGAGVILAASSCDGAGPEERGDGLRISRPKKKANRERPAQWSATIIRSPVGAMMDSPREEARKIEVFRSAERIQVFP